MNIKDKVKALNTDLLIHKHNAKIIDLNNTKGLLDESKSREAKLSYENILARIDTDKNTTKTGGHYKYNVPLDTKKLLGVGKNKPTINIRGA